MLDLLHLEEVRLLMIEELNLDEAADAIYLSPRLTVSGTRKYPAVLRKAITSRDDEWMASELRRPGFLQTTEVSHRRSVPYTKRVPVNAPELLAEGELNRFYIRAVCRLAQQMGIPDLRICRVKAVASPRPESVQKIGTFINAEALLADLRNNIGVDTALGVPPGPGSGLSVCLP